MPGDGGVTVVVDATELDGELAVGCAPGSPQSGFDALVAAGFSVEAVTATPGMLCRIDGRPTPSEETCADDPPTDFYWAYWTVESGGWRYATEGAATREPEVGSVEGWSFVDGGTPPTATRGRSHRARRGWLPPSRSIRPILFPVFRGQLRSVSGSWPPSPWSATAMLRRRRGEIDGPS